MNLVRILLESLAGLVLFLYGVSRLAETLKAIAGDRLKSVLAKFTTNRFAGVGTGTVVTTLLDSSSVTIVMVIAIVDAGLLPFARALAVIMGANIGTTISSQLYAFDVDEYAPLLLLTGFTAHALAREETWRRAGLMVFGVGLIFFGLHVMGEAVEPLKEHESFVGWMKNMERPLQGAAIGALVTVMIQSSSATLGMVIALAGQNLITLPAGVAVMLGAEIGTCADTLAASVGRSRDAVRAGLFHLIFNVLTVALGLLFIDQITALTVWVSRGAGAERQIANAHLAFNLLGVLLVVGFTRWLAALLKLIVPDGVPVAHEEKLPD